MKENNILNNIYEWIQDYREKHSIMAIRNLFISNDDDIIVSNNPKIDNVWDYYLTREQSRLLLINWQVLVKRWQVVKIKDVFIEELSPKI